MPKSSALGSREKGSILGIRLGIPKEMDDIDRKLLRLLSGNPRMRFEELAKRVGISRQAVHHRMQVLTQMGIAKGTIAGVSISYLNAVPVTIFGRSETASVEQTMDRLGESEFSRRVIVAGGNFLYVVGFLREMSELGGYVEFVRRKGEIPEPTVGINCLDDGLSPDYLVDGSGKQRQGYRELSELDLRIIASLEDNARRPTSEVARMAGVSAKTARRHLEAMISDGSLEMSAPADTVLGGDIFIIMHVTLKDGAEKNEVGRRLLSKCHFQDQLMRTFNNLPSLLLWAVWSDKMTDVRRALKQTSEDDDVMSVMLNFAYLERIYPSTWRDKLPIGQAHSQLEFDAHQPHSRPTIH